MDYILENEYLKITITTWGAQLKSVVRKCDGVEHMWQADKSHWGYHAPILFPFCGKVKDGMIEARGQHFENLPQHGFARIGDHNLLQHTENTVVLELRDSEATMAMWPYAFRLVTTYTLDRDTVHHTLTVLNADDEPISFGIGYHPGFAIPFDENHAATDYEFRFDTPQSPLCLNCMPTGLYQGNSYYLGYNTDTIPIDENLFSNDSHCMVGLSAKTLGVYEKGSGRGVVCDISSFPYTLIWSKPGMPRFVCIEPWHSIPSSQDGDHKWEHKAAAATIAPGESWSTTLSMTFQR
jgi:aldose 1-epimerase